MTFEMYVLCLPRTSRAIRSARYANPPYIQYSQKTPMPSQNGAKSGLIMQKAPWIDQKMKKTMNKWWVYQKRSKFARRAFSAAVSAMAIKENSMTYPLQPGPVAKLARMKPMNPKLLPAENLARLFQCAIVCTHEKKTIDHATSLWNVMFSSPALSSPMASLARSP